MEGCDKNYTDVLLSNNSLKLIYMNDWCFFTAIFVHMVG